MFSHEFIRVMNYIAPGLISVIMLNLLIVRKKQRNINIMIEAFIFTVINNNLAFWILGYSLSNYYLKKYFDHTYISVYIIALITPIIIAILAKFTKFSIAILFSKISNKQNNMNTWIEFLKESDQQFVMIHFLKDKKKLMGYIYRASANIDEGLIYLHNAQWINENNQPKKLEKVLINYRNIDYIQVLQEDM